MDTPATEHDAFTIGLRQQADYRFEVHLDNPSVPVIVTDESPPLCGDAGPDPARLLAAAMADYERALAQFKDFCLSTHCVRQAFPVDACVFDRHRAQLEPRAAT